MARKKPNSKDSRQQTAQGNFIKLVFSDDQKQRCNDWLAVNEPTFEAMAVKLTDKNWKISFSYSDYYDCYFASATCKDESSPYHNLVFSLQHAQLVKAFGVLVFAVLVMAENEEIIVPTSSNPFDW